MPDISISRDQQAYIEALRDELDEEMTYGHVRVQDAVQYLIDHHREDGDLDVEIRPETPRTPDGVGDPGGDGKAGDAGDDADAGGPTPTDATEGSGVDDAVAALGDAGPGGGGPGPGAGDGSDEDDSVSGDPGGPPEGVTTKSGGAATIGGADSDKVSEMMNLMDAHDEVWEQTDGAEGKYAVELPDGSRETVATKDDVRALLFKHYR